MPAYKRVNTNNSSTDSGQISSIVYNHIAGATKVAPVGLLLIPSGTLASPQSFAPGQSVYIYNNSSAVGFVALYQSGSSAPALALGTAIPVPPNSYLPLNMGEYNTISGSAATLGLLLVADSSKFTALPTTDL